MIPNPSPIPQPVCPACRSPLKETAGDTIPRAGGAPTDSTVCAGCARTYPRLYGILDLRPDPTPSAWDDADRETAEALAAAFAGASYRDLVALQQSRRRASEIRGMQAHYMEYLLDQEERSRNMADGFHGRMERLFPGGRRGGVALDLGCGSGAGLAALAERYSAVVGVEPGLSNLILAKKALETIPAGRVLLVRGVGQALPFADCVFDYVQMQNVIEHVIDADPVAAETRRVLAAGGRFAADSRNRYDLFRREPHVHLRGVGFLPVRWQKRYVWFRKRIRYEQTRLWSYGELKRILKRHFGRDFRIVFPVLAAYGQPGSLDRWFGRIGRIPLFGGLLLRFFPSHWVFACKN